MPEPGSKPLNKRRKKKTTWIPNFSRSISIRSRSIKKNVREYRKKYKWQSAVKWMGKLMTMATTTDNLINETVSVSPHETLCAKTKNETKEKTKKKKETKAAYAT